MPRIFVQSLLLGVAAAWSTSCQAPAVFSRRPPAAEFLLAAGDSTYWIRSNADGLRVRSAPILLTKADGRFFEIYITDDVHDYTDASFASARAYRRDILQADSVLVYEEGTVPAEARRWIQRHPRAIPLDPSDDMPDDAPPTLVSDDLEVLDVFGPWLTFGYSLDVDIAGREDHRHRRHHGVVDIRSGTRGTLQTLFGANEAARLYELGVKTFAAMRDSVRRSQDERGAAARRTLASFVFDSLSFALTDVARHPAVSFLVPGTGEQGEALSLYLPPLAASAPDWWSAVANTLPLWNSDTTELSWSRAHYDVVAHPTSSGDFLAIEMIDRSHKGAVRKWPIATIAAPAYQLIALDETPLDSVTRVALARAFDQSTVLNGSAQQASLNRRSSEQPLRLVSRRVPPEIKNGGNTCCSTTRRVCRDARAKLSPLHHLPVCLDTRHPDSGDRRRVAGL
ncbi:MAG: hypothetical protein ABJB74_20465 [Gemmatimonas sp.]